MTLLENPSLKISDINLDDPSTKRSARLTKALGHPVRLAILKMLNERETCFCGDITDVLPLAQSTVSQHLKVLKDTGLITGTISGVRTCYCLNPDGIDELRSCLQNLSGMFDIDNAARLKELVKNKYSEIANRSQEGRQVSCCGPSGCCDSSGENITESDALISVMAESYDRLDGYQPGADLQLGCGIPVEFAELKPGQSVLDLGSGAGNDVFVARSIVGETGWVTGLDFSEAMIRKARLNVEKTGYKNITFVSGDIEEMPLDSGRFDVVLSNCVLNLVPDKKRAFSEIHRVLKPGGHFTISDIVLEGTIPAPVRNAAEAWVGCVAGATQKDDYLDIVKNAGFSDVVIQKEREIEIPSELFVRMQSEGDSKMEGFDLTTTTFKVLSITLTGEKS